MAETETSSSYMCVKNNSDNTIYLKAGTSHFSGDIKPREVKKVEITGQNDAWIYAKPGDEEWGGIRTNFWITLTVKGRNDYCVTNEYDCKG